MKLIDLLFPRQCINCSTLWAYLCKSCKKQLNPHPEICPYCHRISKDYKTCIECRCNKNNALEGIIIPFAYTDVLKTLIIKLKYFHKRDIGEFLVERLSIALQANQSLNRNIIISFIPSHWYRHYFVKGYNQSELLARKLSEKLQVPIVAIANKKKHTKTQASLDREGRLKNLKNAFSLTQNLTLLGNETMLIVDDITTTWSTINEIAKLIKHYYPRIKIRWAVLWRHMDK
jgi:ComF family protein